MILVSELDFDLILHQSKNILQFEKAKLSRVEVKVQEGLHLLRELSQ